MFVTGESLENHANCLKRTAVKCLLKKEVQLLVAAVVLHMLNNNQSVRNRYARVDSIKIPEKMIPTER